MPARLETRLCILVELVFYTYARLSRSSIDEKPASETGSTAAASRDKGFFGYDGGIVAIPHVGAFSLHTRLVRDTRGH